MNFISSFKRIGKGYKGYLAAICFDAMQYAVLLLVLLISSVVFYRLYIPLLDVQETANEVNQNIAENNEFFQLTEELSEKMDRSIDTVKDFIANLIALAAITYAVLLFCSGIGRALVYSRLKKRKFSRRYLFRFLKYNTLWILFWNIMFVLDFVLFKPVVSAFIFLGQLILYFHFSVIFRYSFNERSRFKNIMRDFFDVGIKKSHRFIIPFILVLLLFIVINQIAFLVAIMPFGIVLLLMLTLIFSFMSWARLYYIQVIEDVR